MNENESEHWFEKRIEAYVDRDLPEADSHRMEAYARESEFAAERLSLARRVKASLVRLPRETCPPDVTLAVLAAARRDARRNVVERIRDMAIGAWTAVIRPSLAVGLLVAIVVAGALVGRDDGRGVDHAERAVNGLRAADGAITGEETEHRHTGEDVDRALHDVKWTLAFISEIGRQTGRSIRREVFDEPAEHALERHLDNGSDRVQ